MFEPRHFWRRFFATVIDVILCMLLSVLILLPFLGNTDRVRLDNDGLTWESCQTITGAPQEALDVIAPKVPMAGEVCDTQVFGIENGLSMSLAYDVTHTGNRTTEIGVTFAVDKDGRPVMPLQPQSLIMAVLLVGLGGWMTRRRGATPGKRFMRLRVENGAEHPFRREALKYAYFILVGTVTVAMWVFGYSATRAFGALSTIQIVGLGVVMFLLTNGYYLLPLIRWRGGMIWDLLCGSSVKRTT